MGILFFTKGDKTMPSSRYRVWFVAERLQKQYDWKFDILHSIGYSAFSISFSRFKLLFTLCYKLQTTNYDIFFVHKSLYPWDVVLLILAAKKILGKKLVYDLDDAEWIHSPRKSRMLARYADVVFCGSHEILAWAKKYNSNYVFIPTVVDADIYRLHTVAHANRELFTIGWIGQGKAHFKAGNFIILRGMFEKLIKHDVRFRFVLVGAQDYEPLKTFFVHVPCEVIFVDNAKWIREDAVPALIQKYQFDIGVMPLQDTLFNRAKCAFKAIEYMACGVPVVASPVGEANYIIQNGENGFLADTPEEWVSIIKTLIEDYSLRKRMGEAGQKLIQEQYSYEHIIPRIQSEIIKLERGIPWV